MAEFEKLEVGEKELVLYGEFGTGLKDGFLSFENIAAIIPDNLPSKRSHIMGIRDPIPFRLHLKKKPEPLEIIADSWDSTDRGVKFFMKMFGSDQIIDHELPNLYIALSEVVAIIPQWPR